MNERSLLLTLIRAALLPEFSGAEVPKDVDWQKLIAEVDRQGVAVIASDGLQRLYDLGCYEAGDDKDVRRLKAKWFGKTMKYEGRYAAQVAAAKKMGEWLSEDGIRTVVMKGFTVSECYPIPSHRFSADFDCFLVRDDEHLEAYELGNQVVEKGPFFFSGNHCFRLLTRISTFLDSSMPLLLVRIEAPDLMPCFHFRQYRLFLPAPFCAVFAPRSKFASLRKVQRMRHRTRYSFQLLPRRGIQPWNRHHQSFRVRMRVCALL